MLGSLTPQKVKLALLGIFFLGTLLVTPWIGERPIGFDVLSRPFASDLDSVIFWQIRVPRTLLAFLAGIGLSLGGVVFQAMFRNPLATPFTLGVAGGASFGVALWVQLGLSFTLLGVSGISFAAMCGAMLSMFVTL